MVFSEVDAAKAQLERISKQFDFGPYPRVPIDEDPRKQLAKMFIHDIRTAFYLRDRKIRDIAGATILDVGCGTGYKTLMLAMANPEAQVIGIDISERSVELSRERANYFKQENTEFRVSSLEKIELIGIKFDYINCDEILYLLNDQESAFQLLASALKPDGVLRGSLHSQNQRQRFFRAQELCSFTGLTNDNPEEFEIEAMVELMNSFQPGVELRRAIWPQERKESADEIREFMLSNLMLLYDKGFTVPQLREYLESAQLQLVGMTDWRSWDIDDLFEKPEDKPAFIELGLESCDSLDKIHFFDLVHPMHRLFDFWVTPLSDLSDQPVFQDMSFEQAKDFQVMLHPQLRHNANLEEALHEACEKRQRFSLTKLVSHGRPEIIEYDYLLASLILPLLKGRMSIRQLVERWQHLQPFDPLTDQPNMLENAYCYVMQYLQELERDLYVMVEPLS